MDRLTPNLYTVGVLVVSDTVSSGQKEDRSGVAVVDLINSGNIFQSSSIKQHCVPDDLAQIQSILKEWADTENIDLILTVGGTGFSPRDVTPEATRAVIDREASHLASRMVLGCCEKSRFSVLSRSVCGMRGKSLILNLPGSVKGSVECFEVIAYALPHALDQLKERTKNVASLHQEIQASGLRK